MHADHDRLLRIVEHAWNALEPHMGELQKRKLAVLNPNSIEWNFMVHGEKALIEAQSKIQDLVSYATLVVEEGLRDVNVYALLGEYGKWNHREVKILDDAVHHFSSSAEVHFAYAQSLLGYSFVNPKHSMEMLKKSLHHFNCALELDGYLYVRVEEYKKRIENCTEIIPFYTD